MVERGLSESRERAQALILAGDVRVNGQTARRPAQAIAPDAEVTVTRPPPYVSRGGYKLAHALDRFGISVDELVLADIGASTGGFSDCLLQHGAARVYAIDVGYGQIDYRLRTDPRVVVMERVNARYLEPLPEPVDLAVADLSFISLTKVLPAVVGSLKPRARLVVLLKPQFEARRNEVGRGGIVRDPLVHAAVVGRFVHWLSSQGYRILGLTLSPIRGASGNREFLMYLQPPDAAA